MNTYQCRLRSDIDCAQETSFLMTDDILTLATIDDHALFAVWLQHRTRVF